MVIDSPAIEIVEDGGYRALWESSFLLLSLKYKKPNETAEALKNRLQAAIAIAKAALL